MRGLVLLWEARGWGYGFRRKGRAPLVKGLAFGWWFGELSPKWAGLDLGLNLVCQNTHFIKGRKRLEFNHLGKLRVKTS